MARYRQVCVNGRRMQATHWALEQDGRPRPFPSAVAMHICDEPLCVDPSHLLWGTQADNLKDMFAKGREARGAARKLSALTDEDVINMRTAWACKGIQQKELAAIYGVSSAAVCLIVNGKTWTHLPMPV